ncbi:uncharacterized protein EI90DRAFT_1756736 [Cantharellus anzutake]|uniref:uncharacterized protein n=1 Tax=Cantharellus anzutake TaxID=1750568 RepID=UPI001908B2DF|nr:uncharacterized protein EI90DRAFT_1756736 [Cantharellus anzutake]KAF8341587.1 hypothetical protein EI90DRAFT_1756736 [Cantharellus anzutake]
MRFWNALIAIALLPNIIAAIHILMVTCGNYQPWKTDTGPPVWVFLPDYLEDFCPSLKLDTDTRNISLGSELTGEPCDSYFGNITVSDELDRWSSPNGKNGKCSPVTYDASDSPGVSRWCQIDLKHWTACLVSDIAYCDARC